MYLVSSTCLHVCGSTFFFVLCSCTLVLFCGFVVSSYNCVSVVSTCTVLCARVRVSFAISTWTYLHSRLYIYYFISVATFTVLFTCLNLQLIAYMYVSLRACVHSLLCLCGCIYYCVYLCTFIFSKCPCRHVCVCVCNVMYVSIFTLSTSTCQYLRVYIYWFVATYTE